MTQYSPATIANYFLRRASQQGSALTPMQVLHLVYIAHGWHLGFRKEPLINEPVQAWRHGPIICSLYEKVKKYGSSGITELLRINLFSSASVSKIDPKAEKVLDAVWDGYGYFGGVKLSEMTRLQCSPWSQTWNTSGQSNPDTLTISNNLIQEFYEKKIRMHAPNNIPCPAVIKGGMDGGIIKGVSLYSLLYSIG